MNLSELSTEHIGHLVSLSQEDSGARVELVGHLSSFELQWSSTGLLMYAWLVIGGKGHPLSTPQEVQRATLEVLP